MAEYITQVTTGKVRFSFVNVFKPKAQNVGQEEKYSITILIPKADVSAKQRIDAAIEEAKRKGAADKWGGVMPPIVPTPVHDGDGARPSDGMPYGHECRGHWVLTASAKADYPPEVVDAQLNPIVVPSDVYSGCYGRISINFFPYGGSYGIKKGVGAGLGPVQKLEDGESLGGGAPAAASVFDVPAVDPLTGAPILGR